MTEPTPQPPPQHMKKVVMNVDMDRCYETIPCRHRVRVLVNGNTVNTVKLGGTAILTLHSRGKYKLSSDELEHFTRYYNRMTPTDREWADREFTDIHFADE